MTASPNSDPSPAAVPPLRSRARARVGYASLAVAVLAVLAVAGGIAFLLSPAGLPFVVERAVERTDGQLRVDAPSGSLAHAMRFRRLEWRGRDVTVTATDVVVEWSPLALFSWRLEIAGLGASRVSIVVQPSTGATAPPDDLALPIGVSIGHAAISELAWEAGPGAAASPASSSGTKAMRTGIACAGSSS